MKNKPITTVFIIDDEFPRDPEFRARGIYNSAISTNDLYHLAINCDWENHLGELQQLIKDIVSNPVCKEEGHIELMGFTSPTQALYSIDQGNIPNIIIYDWEYLNAPSYSLNAKNWLLELLHTAREAFIFVYSKRRDEIPPFLNIAEFAKFSERFQLLMKGGKIKSSFSAEEFILQYIIGSASNSGKIKIDGIPIEFAANNYLLSASDILYLQRILGNQYVLDELNNVDFLINEASVEKILNDSEGFLYYNEEKKILINPNENYDMEKFHPYGKLSYLEVVKKFSIAQLEDALERGVLPV
ncbi:hypothetical protein POV26_08820 [Aequorivita todarodis]|uniref:hypothetical protein n=1 Tax=Aequorivita todarodis TaxID=2036821 RepID=UPI0023507870|nr:hypothetical protein [Aequorivita todarodis]MDC8001138.1 hypothetical protein [Aequorivita todarodis]